MENDIYIHLVEGIYDCCHASGDTVDMLPIHLDVKKSFLIMEACFEGNHNSIPLLRSTWSWNCHRDILDSVNPFLTHSYDAILSLLLHCPNFIACPQE